jgi:hypothetical protein
MTSDTERCLLWAVAHVVEWMLSTAFIAALLWAAHVFIGRFHD